SKTSREGNSRNTQRADENQHNSDRRGPNGGAFDVSGKVTIITGASRGIGRQLALDCAREGHPVVVNFVSAQEAADEVVRTIVDAGGQALAVEGGVRGGGGDG